MKSLLHLVILFMLFINAYAQVNIDSFNAKYINDLTSSIQLEQKFRILNEVDFEMAPQFGGLFTKVFNEVIPKAILKNYYKDFAFGLNLRMSYNSLKNLNIAAFYNVGMLKFNHLNYGFVSGPVMKLSIDYRF